MKDQLLIFYYFHVLAEIIQPNLSVEQKRWCTLKDLVFCGNGLVNDISYYKQLTNKKQYKVTLIQSMKKNVKELLIDQLLPRYIDKHQIFQLFLTINTRVESSLIA